MRLILVTARNTFITTLFSILFLYPNFILAGSPPKLISPTNDAKTSETSVKLTWENSESCPTNASCYRVELDDSLDFSSINKSTYTNNLYYSPQDLTLGKWYWRVKAKDQSENWSEFSENWSFEITNSTTQTPTPSQQSTTSTETPTPSTTSKPSQTFVITSMPNNISSTEEISTQIQLSNFSPTTSFYLKGAFFKNGSTNYFGKTQVFGNWIKNSENYAKQFLITTDSLGNWTGSFKVMVDSDDSGFSGSGKYAFKVGRYSQTGSGPNWSNEVFLDITDLSPKEETTKKSSTTVLETEPDYSESIVQTPAPLEKAQLIKTEIIRPAIASVSGVSTDSAQEQKFDETLVKTERKINWWLISGGLVFLIISGGLVVVIFKKR